MFAFLVLFGLKTEERTSVGDLKNKQTKKNMTNTSQNVKMKKAPIEINYQINSKDKDKQINQPYPE